MSTTRNSTSARSGMFVVPVLILFVSSSLKFRSTIVSAVLQPQGGISLILEVLLPFLEIALAIWLCSNFLTSQCRITAILVFFFFLSVSTYKLLSGEANCGCFGQLQVSPKLTVPLNLLCLWMLVSWEAMGKKSAVSYAVCILGFVFAGSILVGLTRFESIEDSMEGDVVILEPEKWLGQELLLFDFVDIPDSLAKGRWHVVIFNENCKDCHIIIDRLENRAQNGVRVLLIEIPPFGNSIRDDTERLFWRRISTKRKWIVKTPTVFEMADGVVIETSSTIQW